MSKWLKEPLLHFLLLGAAIFLVYGWVSDERSADEIFISSGQQDNLINTFSRTWQRPPTPAEFKGLLDDYVREEIAYREGRAMGLDDNDVIIRRRLRQKLELLAEDVATLGGVPSEEELQVYLDEHIADYLIEARLSLKQLYFSPDKREDPAADAATMLAELGTAGATPELVGLGDAITLPTEIRGLRESEIARLFGAVFAEQLETAETGRWIGPVESGFGLHLVYITERISSSEPSLDEVRDAVQRDWFSLRRREAVDGLYQRLAESYQIEIEAPTDTAAEGVGEAGSK